MKIHLLTIKPFSPAGEKKNNILITYGYGDKTGNDFFLAADMKRNVL